jgi:hypothetical protein
MDAAGYYFLDGQDMWTTYGVFIEKGSDEFLLFPERKDSLKYDWMDQNGIDLDVSNPVYKEREMTLQCAIIANNQDDFWDKYQSFMDKLMSPGLRTLTIKEFEKDYAVVYLKCNSFTRFTRLKTANKIAAKFTITFMEPAISEILTDEFGVPLTDDDGNILTP